MVQGIARSTVTWVVMKHRHAAIVRTEWTLEHTLLNQGCRQHPLNRQCEGVGDMHVMMQ